MQLPPLYPAKLIKRYKRFLADAQLADGTIITAHCPNTGAMTGCGQEGDRIWLSLSENTSRKYPYTWVLTEKADHSLICVNTLLANHIVDDALTHKAIAPLLAYNTIQREVRYGEENSRIDFFLSEPGLPNCFVEVKSVTLLENEQGYFPDAKTLRGQKHLRELQAMVNQGHRAVLLFIALHSNIHSIAAANHIDPLYAETLYKVLGSGVEVICYRTCITLNEIKITHCLPFKK